MTITYFLLTLQKNEIELEKDKKHMVSGLSINQKTDADVIIHDSNAKNSLSGMIRSYKEERKKFNLDYHFCKKEVTY